MQLPQSTFTVRIDKLAALGLLDESRTIGIEHGPILIFDADDERAKEIRDKMKPKPVDPIADLNRRRYEIDPSYDPARHKYVGRCCS